MASKLVLKCIVNTTDLETLNSTNQDSENSFMMNFSGIVGNNTAPLKNYTRSRFSDHFKLKDSENVPDDGKVFVDFEVRKKEKNRTILTSKSKLISKLTSIEEIEDDLASNTIFKQNKINKKEKKDTRTKTRLICKKSIRLRRLKHQPSKHVIKRTTRKFILNIQLNLNESASTQQSSFSIFQLAEAINRYEQSSAKQRIETEKMLINSINNLLVTQDGTSLIKAVYPLIKKNSSTRNIITAIDFKTNALSGNYHNIIEIINLIYETDTADGDLLYQQINSEDIWEALISSKNGKNVIETLMSNFFKNNPSCHSKLFSVIHSNFLNFSKSNYTTFVVQKYISIFRSGEAFSLVQLNFDALISNRNGIFVIISALKSFKKEKLSLLLDMIMDKVEILSKGIYTSTMIEFVFKTFPQFCVDFTNSKLAYLIGKI